MQRTGYISPYFGIHFTQYSTQSFSSNLNSFSGWIIIFYKIKCPFADSHARMLHVVNTIGQRDKNERNTIGSSVSCAITRITRNRRVYTDSSVEGRQAKTVTLCERQRAQADTPLFSLTFLSSRTLEAETRKKKRENTVARTFYIRGHALERRIVTGVQRGRNFDGVFSLKQLSIGFPLEEALPSALPRQYLDPVCFSFWGLSGRWMGKRGGYFPNGYSSVKKRSMWRKMYSIIYTRCTSIGKIYKICITCVVCNILYEILSMH